MSHSHGIASVLLAGVARAVANGAALVGKAWTLHRHRRAVRELWRVDDHMLRDIGLTRGDVAAALSLPLDKDPSTRLRVLAVERRAAHRAQRREAIAAVHAAAQTGGDTDNRRIDDRLSV